MTCRVELESEELMKRWAENADESDLWGGIMELMRLARSYRGGRHKKQAKRLDKLVDGAVEHYERRFGSFIPF